MAGDRTCYGPGRWEYTPERGSAREGAADAHSDGTIHACTRTRRSTGCGRVRHLAGHQRTGRIRCAGGTVVQHRGRHRHLHVPPDRRDGALGGAGRRHQRAGPRDRWQGRLERCRGGRQLQLLLRHVHRHPGRDPPDQRRRQRLGQHRGLERRWRRDGRRRRWWRRVRHPQGRQRPRQPHHHRGWWRRSRGLDRQRHGWRRWHRRHHRIRRLVGDRIRRQRRRRRRRPVRRWRRRRGSRPECGMDANPATRRNGWQRQQRSGRHLDARCAAGERWRWRRRWRPLRRWQWRRRHQLHAHLRRRRGVRRRCRGRWWWWHELPQRGPHRLGHHQHHRRAVDHPHVRGAQRGADDRVRSQHGDPVGRRELHGDPRLVARSDADRHADPHGHLQPGARHQPRARQLPGDSDGDERHVARRHGHGDREGGRHHPADDHEPAGQPHGVDHRSERHGGHLRHARIRRQLHRRHDLADTGAGLRLDLPGGCHHRRVHRDRRLRQPTVGLVHGDREPGRPRRRSTRSPTSRSTRRQACARPPCPPPRPTPTARRCLR